MDNKKILLKLGGRKHLGEARWQGALTLFDEIYVTRFFTEWQWDIPDARVTTLEIPRRFLTSKLLGLLKRTDSHPKLNLLSALAIWGMQLMNRPLLLQLSQIQATHVLCSYSDYDKSDLTCLIAKPALQAPIVRAYKETRCGYSFLEKKALEAAQTIVLYDAALQTFLEEKYGSGLFHGKQLLLGYDENVLPSCILGHVPYREKLSVTDGMVHLVILSFRVDSSPHGKRDAYRYYYLDVIQQLIAANIVVHLHCAQFNDDNGVNRYTELHRQFPDRFHLEPPLDMKYDSTPEAWTEACAVLSQYDAGLLHNIVANSSVSEFDRINVPHRYFAYEAAHVTPILRQGENPILEERFIRQHCGFVYRQFSDLSQLLTTSTLYDTPCYEDYLQAIFDLS